MNIKRITTAAFAAAVSLSCSASLRADAIKLDYNDGYWRQIGYVGDIDGNGSLGAADMVLLESHLMGKTPLTAANSYRLDYDNFAVDGHKPEHSNGRFITADIDRDGKITAFDMVQLREAISDNDWKKVWVYSSGNYYRPSKLDYNKDYIYPSIQQHAPFMPSHGTAKAVIFYVDFPDCKYDYEPDLDYIRQISFGGEDTADPSFPFESMAAFYKRSSKGALSLEGDVFRYTAKKSIADYSLDHGSLLVECLTALDDSVDFSQFDGNGDGCIDVSIINVPNSDYDSYWWPAAIAEGWNRKTTVDGLKIGHMISGTESIAAPYDHESFSYTLLHEMGHAMGLPDYYVYSGGQGMAGTAGWEDMDDSMCDMGALSKLLLGWYKNDQVSIFNPNSGSQTFVLKNAQSDEGNCVIIPNGRIEEDFNCEYFIMEYNTPDGNNAFVRDIYRNTSSGLRIFHADTEVYLPLSKYTGYLYDNYNSPNYESGRRVVRLVNSASGTYDENYFHAGDVIDNSVSGFGWYDDYEQETIDPGVTVTVDSIDGDECIVTISVK